jgi:hypothetical protein
LGVYARSIVFYTAPSFFWNSMGVSESDASNAATEFVQDTFGMPADAVLTSTLERWQIIPAAGGGEVTPIGYEFIWTHANGMIGGDAIKVFVDDNTTPQTTCTEWQTPPSSIHRRGSTLRPSVAPTGPIDVCLKWVTTYTHTPDIPYGYRLWRTLSGSNTTEQPAGVTSIDAVTASTALPEGANITAYRRGLWSPMPTKSSSLGAQAVWIFTLSGKNEVAVDAYTGQVLGGNAYW